MYLPRTVDYNAMIFSIIEASLQQTTSEAHLIHGHRFIALTFKEPLGRKRKRTVFRRKDGTMSWTDSGQPVDAYSRLRINEAIVRFGLHLA